MIGDEDEGIVRVEEETNKRQHLKTVGITQKLQPSLNSLSVELEAIPVFQVIKMLVFVLKWETYTALQLVLLIVPTFCLNLSLPP